jgi:copper chaperone CopZ
MAIAILCTSCIEIKEEVSFNKNFSGNAKYSLDMSFMKSIGGLLGKTSSDKSALNSLTEAGNLFAQQAASLKEVKGVKKVKYEIDKKNFVYSIMFQFSDLNALNAAAQKTNLFSLSGVPVYTYAASNKSLIRRSVAETASLQKLFPLNDMPSFPAQPDSNVSSTEELSKALENLTAQMGELLNSIQISSNISFPKSEIVSSSCDGTLAGNKKTINFNKGLSDFKNAPVWNCAIQLK